MNCGVVELLFKVFLLTLILSHIVIVLLVNLLRGQMLLLRRSQRIALIGGDGLRL